MNNRKAWQHPTESRHARGYGTAWDKLRLVILARDNYLCQCDRCQGGKLRVTAASHVDHIIAKANEGTDDPSNLRAVNAQCHERITIQAKGHTLKTKVGLDGYPTGIAA